MKTVLINILSFKAGWVASVAGAAASVPVLGAAAATGVVSFHLWRIKNVRAEAQLLIFAALIGLAWESALVWAGLINYDAGFLVPGFAPYWIVAMWVLFATTLNVGMRWLRRNVIVTSLVGAVGGPLAFMAGESMGAVSFNNPSTSLVVIGIGWALLLPLLVKLATRFDGQLVEVNTVGQRAGGYAQ